MARNKEGKLRAAAVAYLLSHGMTPVFESCGNCDVVGVKWLARVGRLIPKIDAIMCIELKLHDITGVIRQASANRHRSNYSLCAMPETAVSKMGKTSRSKFICAEVGLLGVFGNEWRVVVPAICNIGYIPADSVRRNLWRRRDEWTKDQELLQAVMK